MNYKIVCTLSIETEWVEFPEEDSSCLLAPRIAKSFLSQSRKEKPRQFLELCGFA